ncbi:tetratricopeptide repeat protein [Roseofilum sp. BLCC_M154]|uniref:Tetratricopeptide repeat protein n=1 Tax=Roseofilum acuticapitatum BLCC-M154 TaxID=3022444 RepID=A0ABT7ANA1_9CYAN|nr:CHAT domain-containing protein [Roseofilum acuticapitatum]MDJ1168372.1 tetratricopeptide repeat protein [Roseofilum acuticapitatum BLCC-M154]
MTQEFHLSVTPVGYVRESASEHLPLRKTYLVRTEYAVPGVPLGEEQVEWPIANWLELTEYLIGDPLFSTPLSSDAVDVLSFGKSLYNSLFQGTIAQSWHTAQGVARNRNEPLRFRLYLKDPLVAKLPWEILHAGDRPLTTNTEILFSRYHINPRVRPLPDNPIVDPLRILMVLSAPNDQQALALDQEMKRLKDELQRHEGMGLNIHLDILTFPDRQQLTETLEQGQYHIFHYSGHSQANAWGGEIYLKNQHNGLTEQLHGEDLAGLLVNNGILMALFNSCSSAGTGDTSLAESLLKRGIPSVLAMGDRIPDRVAITFSQLFYRNLKREYAIDLSLNRTRQGLIATYGSDTLYFALPILYLQPGFEQFSPVNNRPHSAPSPLPLAAPTPGDRPPAKKNKAYYQQRIQNNPQDVEAYDQLGLIVYQEGQIEDAIAAHQMALLIDGSYTDAYYHLGCIFYDQGQIQESVEFYRKALNIDPQHPQANLALNQALSHSQAVAALPVKIPEEQQLPDQKRWIKFPAFPLPMIRLGWMGMSIVAALSLLIVAAFPAYRSWINFQQKSTIVLPSPSPVESSNPENANQTLRNQAISEFNQGNIEQGITHVEALLDSDNAVISYAKQALESVPHQFKNEPEINYIWGRLVWQALQQGNLEFSADDARRYWEWAIKGDDQEPKYYNALGFAYSAQGNWYEARKNFSRARRIAEAQASPEVLTAYAGLALVLAQDNQEEEGIELYKTVMKSDPLGFEPRSLGRNTWLWTNEAIAQWGFLGDRATKLAENGE